ncbi:protein of unknown function [Burkholderia multivorans]
MRRPRCSCRRYVALPPDNRSYQDCIGFARAKFPVDVRKPRLLIWCEAGQHDGWALYLIEAVSGCPKPLCAGALARLVLVDRCVLSRYLKGRIIKAIRAFSSGHFEPRSLSAVRPLGLASGPSKGCLHVADVVSLGASVAAADATALTATIERFRYCLIAWLYPVPTSSIACCRILTIDCRRPTWPGSIFPATSV